MNLTYKAFASSCELCSTWIQSRKIPTLQPDLLLATSRSRISLFHFTLISQIWDWIFVAKAICNELRLFSWEYNGWALARGDAVIHRNWELELFSYGYSEEEIMRRDRFNRNFNEAARVVPWCAVSKNRKRRESRTLCVEWVEQTAETTNCSPLFVSIFFLAPLARLIWAVISARAHPRWSNHTIQKLILLTIQTLNSNWIQVDLPSYSLHFWIEFPQFSFFLNGFGGEASIYFDYDMIPL